MIEMNCDQLHLALLVIDKEIEFIFDNEYSFLEKFGANNYKHCEDSLGISTDITRVSFSSDSVYFGYILDCGQHMSDNITLDEYVQWKQSIDQWEVKDE